MNGSHVDIPTRMQAAVYEAPGRVAVRSLPVPEIGPGELLVRVEACGVCGTDLKKIEHGLQDPPRIYGHEFAGTVVAIGEGAAWEVGQRVAAYHHVPCRRCVYCRHGAYSQCPGYKKTGTTAGYEPAGGGWAQFVRIMDWIARDGTVAVPDDVDFAHASLMEPLNTCLKCVNATELRPEESVLIFGQGPVGLMLTQLCVHRGARVIAADLMESRLALARQFGAQAALDPSAGQFEATVRKFTEGRGVDLALIATPSERAVRGAINLTRPAGRVMLFAQTEKDQEMALQVGQVCVLEKRLLGSYSSSIDLNGEVARLLFDQVIPAADLITHRFPLRRIGDAIELATHPTPESLKVVIMPNQED